MTTNIRLAEIRLRNWKAYRQARLVLPATGRVAVIGGDNGAGKTSLLEALALGLYGREGLGLVARARDRRRGEASYDGFLERALNTEAGSDASMSVELVFEGGPRGRIALERVWYFSAARRHERDDEDVRLFEGPDDDLVPIPAEDREAFLHAWIADTLLPLNLAPFFIFDGEHVDRLAGQDLEGQVRSAAETVMGVPLLRQTMQDLRAYARERRRDSREADGSQLQALTSEVVALEGREDALRSAVEAINDQLAPLRGQRDALVARIGGLHGDSYASFKGLFEARERLVRDRSDRQDALRRALSVDLALALSGDGLRRAVHRRLEAEALRERWQSGLQTSEERYAAFTDLLGAELRSGDQGRRVRSAWEAVWNRPPAGAAPSIRHTHLGEAERLLVVRHLDALSDAAGSRIAELTHAVQALDVEIDELEARIARQNGVDTLSRSLAQELREVQEGIAELEARRKVDVETLDAVRHDLAPIKSEMSLTIQLHAEAAPALRRADRAEAYASVLEEVIDSGLPERMAQLSEAVTVAYRAMAHKGEVDRVEITASGDVRLLDARGEDIRSRDASAGETQIFALALMAAIGGSSSGFPLVMDTPFARLDPRHRRNVLRYFAGLGAQLVLLAHPAELSQDDLADLGDLVAPPVDIIQEAVGDRRVSRIGKPGGDCGWA